MTDRTVIVATTQTLLAAAGALGLGTMAYQSAAAYQPIDGDLTAVAALGTTGLLARTGGGTYATRTIAGESGVLSVASGNGVSGNPTLSLDANGIGVTKLLQVSTGTVLGRSTAGTGNLEVLSTLPTGVQDNITRLGTIASGTWNGSPIGLAYGGTGVNNSAASSGTFLRGNGTGYASSTLTLPNTLSSGDLLYASSASVAAGLAIGASAGQLLRSTGSLPAWSTATHPNTIAAGDLHYGSSSNVVGNLAIGASAGQMLRSTGSLPAWSTTTWPNTLTANQVLYGTGTNAVGGSSALQFTGTRLGILAAPSYQVDLQVGAMTDGSAGLAVRYNSSNTPMVIGVDQTSGLPWFGFNANQTAGNNQTYALTSALPAMKFGMVGSVTAALGIYVASGGTAGNAISWTLGTAFNTNGGITIGASYATSTAPPTSGLRVEGQTLVGAGSISSNAWIGSRTSGGNSMEFGHTSSGYGSTLGADAVNGNPFLAFTAEAGTTNNTYRTRGQVGTVLRGDRAGNVTVGSVTNSNADNQSLTVRATIGALSFFGGSTAPTAVVHLAAGTTAASTAPFKWTSGPLLSSAEVGADEFLTDKRYITITTGTARKEYTLNDAALTSGKVPIATTNGRLTDWLTPGTSVATALAVNVGTDGAFVVKGGALGSPSSVGTMPAFTMAGSITIPDGTTVQWPDASNRIFFNGGAFRVDVGGSQQIGASSTAVTFPTVGTTASAANAFLDNAASNSLLRSTSSQRYKTGAELLAIDDARGIVLRAARNAISYSSLAPADKPWQRHLGFYAEEIALVDERLVHRNREGLPESVQYERFVVPMSVMLADHDERLRRAGF